MYYDNLNASRWFVFTTSRAHHRVEDRIFKNLELGDLKLPNFLVYLGITETISDANAWGCCSK